MMLLGACPCGFTHQRFWKSVIRSNGITLASRASASSRAHTVASIKNKGRRGMKNILESQVPCLISEVVKERPGRPSVALLRQFETLWLKYREELQMGKHAAASVLDDVVKGRLPCDADLLQYRARTLLLLDPLLPRLRLRQLLASTPRTLLAHDPQLLLDRAQRFAALLPSYDTTHVLMTVMPYLDRDPVVTAANLLELDDVFCRAFGGARVPPSVYAHLLRAPGATLLPPASQSPSPGLSDPSTTPLSNSPAIVPASLQPASHGANQATQSAPNAWNTRSTGQRFGAGPLVVQQPTDGRGPYGPDRPEEKLPALARQDPKGRLDQQAPAQQLQLRRQARSEAQSLQGVQQRQPEKMAQGPYRLQAQLLAHPNRRYVNSVQLLHRLEDLVSLFGRETAYVSVQRHPDLLDRDPKDLAARAVQLLAAIDPRVGGLPASAILGGGGDRTPTSRPLARLLEDAPEVLDLELGEVRQRVQELSSALEWTSEQVSQLVLHDPAVLLRDPSFCRENFIRLRLYALRRPSTWGVELAACLSCNNPAAKNDAASPAATTETIQRGRKGRQLSSKAAVAEPVMGASTVTHPARSGHRDDDKNQGAIASLSHVAGELDAELLSMVARVLTIEEECLDRFEYVILTGERSEASVRELLYESRLKFVRQCPRYSRWWAEGAARQRGERAGTFGLGSGLEEQAAGKYVDGTRGEVISGEIDEGSGGTKGLWLGVMPDSHWVEDDDRLLDADDDLM